MSFLKITDPKKREAMIREFIETRKRIKDNLIAEKTGEMELQTDLSKFYRPITETQKATTREITEGLKPIKEGIEKLPQAIPLIEPPTPPPPYEAPFADEYTVPGEEKIDSRRLPGYFKKTEKGYKLGNLFIDFDEVTKNVLFNDGRIFSDSLEIYDIFTNKESNVTWKDLNKQDKIKLGVFIIVSEAIQKNDRNAPIKIGGSKKWDDLYSHIWFNRFIYMTEEEVNKNEELRSDAVKLLKRPNKKTTDITKERIKKILNIDRTPQVDPIEGTGIIISSDPNALLERLDLLLASQEAGHTGVRNELVSICDELKRQGVINANEYKNLNSIIKK